ncbi:isopentenyl-diphosphate Delta-isomerase [Gulosibacter macacae]|uniref:Isopentenyl-diphosphate Delta-isomerase n=1 Tax=Gulosibacter macacae TaxID=2488791 RepID=A0A3P3VV79_9MICO|nr:isopentenyl-diphosphate Delta-isomerase [Gulosibacter macacae]RRJ86247.1 isopentenyl-diphosphate Delta-isomerase [Gulosibacter macacae]
MTDDLVVLVDTDGTPIGSAPRDSVHTTDTPLHLAFSCHLVDNRGRMLLTRRALTKVTWPGVWTNAFCGHPRPDELNVDAVRRRARQELGVEIRGIRPLIPEFRYRAVDASGVVEQEICPVFIAEIDGELNPNPDEVMEWAWADVAEVRRAVTSTPFVFSPWLVEQLKQWPRDPVG